MCIHVFRFVWVWKYLCSSETGEAVQRLEPKRPSSNPGLNTQYLLDLGASPVTSFCHHVPPSGNWG